MHTFFENVTLERSNENQARKQQRIADQAAQRAKTLPKPTKEQREAEKEAAAARKRAYDEAVAVFQAQIDAEDPSGQARQALKEEAMETVFVIPDSLKRGGRRFAHFVLTDGVSMRLGTARPTRDDATS